MYVGASYSRASVQRILLTLETICQSKIKHDKNPR